MRIGEPVENTKSGNIGVITAIRDDEITVRRIDTEKLAKWRAKNAKSLLNGKFEAVWRGQVILSRFKIGTIAEIIRELDTEPWETLCHSLEIYPAGKMSPVYSAPRDFNIDFFSPGQFIRIASAARRHPIHCAETGHEFDAGGYRWAMELKFNPINEAWLKKLLTRAHSVDIAFPKGSGAGVMTVLCPTGKSLDIEDITKHCKFKPLIYSHKVLPLTRAVAAA